MGRYWRNVETNCMICRTSVAKMTIKNGKIVVEKYLDNWGCWRKIPGKSEMQVLCRFCQKREERKRRKKERGQ